jgi:hypothetical protein
MMTLEQAKTLVRSGYLGRAGIHAVGLRRSDNAVLVYVHDDSPEQRALMEQIRAAVSPFILRAVHEQQPVLAAG